MMLKKTEKNSLERNEEFDLKFQNLGEHACHYAVAIATSKIADKQLSQ